jgi:uncharacterized protein YbgA (DUF1722 family)/uncharacterized protein YbbK (DUF523 family)
MEMKKISIGISSCLLGERVRYDGGHKLDHYLSGILGQFVDWVPICPEVEAGLPIPREAMRLEGDPESPHLVTRKTRVDHTAMMKRWIRGKIKDLQREDLCGFVFKSRSPSSGMQRVKVYEPSSESIKMGRGMFAGAFMDAFPHIPVEDEGRLHDPGLRENFIERVFAFKRWKDIESKGKTRSNLVAFHAAHKLQLMAHSPKHLRELGRIVSVAKQQSPASLHEAYFNIFMEALKHKTTTRKNTNVLQHIMGYFKKRLTPDEKQELLEVITNYHKGLIPLIVPVTLLNHYVRKYEEPYLKTQYYLNPHPIEIMLRNHI